MSDSNMAETTVRETEVLQALKKEVLDGGKSYRARVLLCMTGCRSMGSMELAETFRVKLDAAGLSEEVEIVDA